MIVLHLLYRILLYLYLIDCQHFALSRTIDREIMFSKKKHNLNLKVKF